MVVSDTVAGVMVENGDLYVGSDTRIARHRVEHLLHHEIGVHVLTYVNGSVQPLRLLAVGLAGYDECQEALGVLAEYLSGGLGPGRLRTLALRVVATRLRSENATFADTVDRLIDLGAAPRAAFMTAMRAHRSGGMTKDALYLRGLVRLFDHLARGGSLSSLLVGKITLDDEPLVGELLERDVLREPPLRPRFLDDDERPSPLGGDPGRDHRARPRGGGGVRIGFVVNDIATELPEYTTTRLAFAASRRGHEVWSFGVGDLAQEPDGTVTGSGRRPGDKRYRSLAGFGRDLLDADGARERVQVDELDVLVLRNDPADDAVDRPWAQRSGLVFGQLAAARGVIVLNDPGTLADAVDKTYFQHFPEEVRPATLISRDPEEIKAFVDDQGGHAVLKPLQGSGGQGVFEVGGASRQNVDQIIESITRDGFVVAQEKLPGADRGDVRILLVNGSALQVGDHYAAFRRRNDRDDLRSNMSAGGKAKPVRVTGEMLDLVELVRPKLIQDGMFLVGIDVMGPRLLEVNVFSPGGLGSAGQLRGVDFAAAVVEAMEKKVRLRAAYGMALSNRALATL